MDIFFKILKKPCLRFYRIVFFLCSFFLLSTANASLVQETIYLTWQRDPSSSMTIQWISSLQEKESIVKYRLKNEGGEWAKSNGEAFSFPYAAKYLIHRVELNNLKSNAEYTFRVSPDEQEFLFLTAPLNLENGIRFVVGGDMYHDEIRLMAKTCKQAALTNPLFALIGGDIAYAVQSSYFPFQKIERWLDWVKVWHATMITTKGYLIPVISAIGNHDLLGQYDQTPAQATIFSSLFPMPGKQIYNVLDFNSYLSIFILDSGHANSIEGTQADWLKKVLDERQMITHRLAIYHVPAYPSVRNYYNKNSTAIRNSWVPIFEKGGIQTVFEHHDHTYKRTYPLLKNRIHKNGLLYIGDGCWGVEKPRKFHSKRYYIAKFASVRHFMGVFLSSKEQRMTCIDDDGHILDECIQTLP